ncbi:MAG TPA: PAS domain S-box protein [Alphaproteobacteria bacterium]|nr:PAS domain S-box protein [Alphaproteobacteria bacterium]
MELRHTTPAWRFAVATIGISVLLTLALLPVADRPGPEFPGITPFFVAGVLVTALATSFLLFIRFREARSWSLLLLAGAYLYFSLMSIPHLMTFPAAMVPEGPLIGTSQSPAWVFMSWVIGFAALTLASITAEARFGHRSIAAASVNSAIATAVAAVVAVIIGIVLTATLAVDWLPTLVSGSSSTGLNYVLGLGAVALAGCGIALILTTIDRRNELFRWLALALMAFACANVLSAAAGGRYTVAWTAGRLSWVISASVLFLYFMAQFARQQRALADARDALERRVQDRTAALRESDERLRRAIESAPFPIMLHASDGAVLALSEAWTRLTGYRRAELRTRFDWTRRAYPETFADVDAFVDQTFRLKKASTSGERTIRTKDGGARVWEFTNVPLGQLPDGRALTLSAVVDITKRKQDEAALAESEARFRAMADNIPQLAWMARPDGFIFWYNKRWYDYTGATLAEMEGWGWRKVHHPDHVDRVVEGMQRSWDTGEPWEDTFPMRGADGQYGWFLSRALPIRDADGKVVLWFGTNTDITDQRMNEERLKLLAREVDHRSKNMLAVLQVMLRHTRAETVKDYAEAVQGRVAALARTHTLLAQARWEGADLKALIDEEVAPYHKSERKSVRTEGPAVALAPEAAQSLAMAVHELATNAAKYGALSAPEGRVAVRWRLQANQELEIAWQESGGPPVKPPTRRGLGTSVIQRSIRDQLGGTVRFDWREQGLRCEIAVPAGQIGRRVRNDAAPEPPHQTGPPGR